MTERILLRLPNVLARTGLSRSTAYRLIASGAFPRPVKVGGTNIAVWDSAAVDRWINEQLERTTP